MRKFYSRTILGLMPGLLTGMVLQAQSTAPLSADRPGISASAGITPQGVIQFENGFEFQRSGSVRTFQLPAIMFRTGITRVAELRLGTGVIRQDSLPEGNGTAARWNTSALTAGTKVNLCRQQRWIPEASLAVGLVFPYTAGSGLRSAWIGHSVLLVTSHDLTPELSLCTNLGGAWEGSQAGGTFSYTTCLGGKITARTGYFLEHYGYWQEKQNLVPGLDAGLYHLLTPSLQLDLSGGGTRAKGTGNYFLSAGVSFKLNARSRLATRKTSPVQAMGQTGIPGFAGVPE